MKHGKSWPAGVLFAVLLNAFTAPLFACSCANTIAGRHACSEAGLSDTVFTGKVAQIKRVVGTVTANTSYQTLLVRFEEIDAFRGIAKTAEEVEVHTGIGGGDCGYTFIEGEKYIIYASRSPSGELWTGVCNLTKPISLAQEDLEYFNSLPLRSVNGWVQGRALIRHANRTFSADGTTGLRVTAASANGSSKQTEISDPTGAFKILNLAPGPYTITASKQHYSVVYQQPATVMVPPKGCATIDILLAGPAP